MDVKRQHYIESKERATFRLFIFLNAINVVFHVVKITLCIIWMTGS